MKLDPTSSSPPPLRCLGCGKPLQKTPHTNGNTCDLKCYDDRGLVVVFILFTVFFIYKVLA